MTSFVKSRIYETFESLENILQGFSYKPHEIYNLTTHEDRHRLMGYGLNLLSMPVLLMLGVMKFFSGGIVSITQVSVPKTFKEIMDAGISKKILYGLSEIDKEELVTFCQEILDQWKLDPSLVINREDSYFTKAKNHMYEAIPYLAKIKNFWVKGGINYSKEQIQEQQLVKKITNEIFRLGYSLGKKAICCSMNDIKEHLIEKGSYVEKEDEPLSLELGVKLSEHNLQAYVLDKKKQVLDEIDEGFEDSHIAGGQRSELGNLSEPLKIHRILSLSGGGVKGIAELVVLAEIEKRTGKSISELFPIISGTSVGGLIAALLTIPKEEGSKEPKYSAAEALKIFKEAAPKIFPSQFLGGIKQIFTHKYDHKALEEFLEKYLGDLRMSETTSRLIITAIDLINQVVEIFDSIDGYGEHIKVRDVARATSAAPTFFAPVIDETAVLGYEYAAGVPYALSDGGLGANRPGGEALKRLKEEPLGEKQHHTRNVRILSFEEQIEKLKKTMMCSLNFIKDTQSNDNVPTRFDGLLGWLIKGNLVSRIMKHMEKEATTEVRHDLPGENQFFEIKLPITKDTKNLDNASPKNIARLEEIGRKYIERNDAQMERLCEVLVSNLKKEQAAKNTITQAVKVEMDAGFAESCKDSSTSTDTELKKAKLVDVKNKIDEGFEEDYEGFEEEAGIKSSVENSKLDHLAPANMEMPCLQLGRQPQEGLIQNASLLNEKGQATNESTAANSNLMNDGFEKNYEDSSTNTDTESEKADLLNSIKKLSDVFSHRNKPLKNDIDNFLETAAGYTLEEIKGFITNFFEAGFNLQTQPSYSGCGTEYLSEETGLSGLDGSSIQPEITV